MGVSGGGVAERRVTLLLDAALECSLGFFSFTFFVERLAERFVARVLEVFLGGGRHFSAVALCSGFGSLPGLACGQYLLARGHRACARSCRAGLYAVLGAFEGVGVG